MSVEKKEKKAMSNSNKKFITIAKALKISQISENSILQMPDNKIIIEIDLKSKNKILSEIKIAFLPQLPACALQSNRLQKKAYIA